MSINLLNDKQFNDYLTDITYQGTPVPKQPNYHGDFESVDYVEQHRDEIIKGILNQYIKLRLREYVVNLENEPAFVLVDKNRTDLPGWTQQTFERGENIYEFNGALMSSQLRNDIVMVRDYLYDAAGQYVDKVIRTARETDKKPKIRYDYLKTSNELSTFEKALAAAKHWHENMAEELAKRNKSKDFLEKSLKGTKKIMDLPDGLTAYELTTEEALDFESDNMGHCVGRGSYDAGVKNGSTHIYSIRDAKGEPHATLEVRYNEVRQIKGKGNRALIRKYVPATFCFIDSQRWGVVNDLANIHAIQQDGKLWYIFNLPKGFVVRGGINLSKQELTELPDLSDVVVEGDFDCSSNQLTSLKGAPQSVGGNFNCSANQLTSLEHAPRTVNGNFNCSYNQLSDLRGAPENIRGNFSCWTNHLISLQGAPQHVGGEFNCNSNMLTDLQGAPQYVGQGFYCSQNRLDSLNGSPRYIGNDFNCSYNRLCDLQGAPIEIGGTFKCNHNMLTSLQGFPQEIGRGFDCSYNELRNLHGVPQDVQGDFNCSHNHLVDLQGAPQHVGGDFGCFYNELTSLQGAPQDINGTFDCSDNKLTSLQGGPENVGGSYNCSHNFLTDLTGAPKHIKSKFVCVDNQLTNLKGLPIGCKYVDCSDNLLTSLEGVSKELDCFSCDKNKLTSLQGGPKKIFYRFSCTENQLSDLNGAPEEVHGDFNATGNPLKSLFGLPKLIKGCLYLGLLSNASEIPAPEYLRDIYTSSNISPEMVEIMIQNGKKLSVKGKLLAGIERLRQKQANEMSQEQQFVGDINGGRE